MSRPRIRLDDVLLPDRRFSISSTPTQLVTPETTTFILDTIAKDPKLQALCLPPAKCLQLNNSLPPIRKVRPDWPRVEPSWRSGLQPPPTDSPLKQSSSPIDWPSGPRTPDPYADYCNPVEAYHRICDDIRQAAAQPSKRLRVEPAVSEAKPQIPEIIPVNRQS